MCHRCGAQNSSQSIIKVTQPKGGLDMRQTGRSLAVLCRQQHQGRCLHGQRCCEAEAALSWVQAHAVQIELHLQVAISVMVGAPLVVAVGR